MDETEEIIGEVWSFGTGDDQRYDFLTYSPAAELKKTLAKKGIEGSNQSEEEIGMSTLASVNVRGNEYINPPYNPQHLADLLEQDETHFRAVSAKVGDIVGKPYVIKSFLRVLKNKKEARQLKLSENDYVLEEKYREQVRVIEKFIEKCNPHKGFLGVLKSAAMDFEAIGWGAIEVIRSYDKKILRIEHVPAARLRVLKGHKGFVELAENTDVPYRYYQNFGEKVGKRRESPLTGRKAFTPFDPDEDNFDDSDLVWNLVDKETFEPIPRGGLPSLSRAANEILFIPKIHPNTIYYGYSDIVPALASVIINARIREYQAQFFENNAIPRYAIIVTGSSLTPELKQSLQEYFTKEVKGQSGKTLVLAIPSSPTKEVKIEFKALDVNSKEADFLETMKANNASIQVAHGTPPAILGVAEHSELGSGKGLSQAELYKDRIIMPNQYFWQEILYRLTSLGLGVTDAYLGFTPFDVRDRMTQSQVLSNYIDRGIYSVNDCLEELDKPPVEGGDEHFIRGDKFIKISDLVNLSSTLVGNNSSQTQAGSNETQEEAEDVRTTE